MLQADRSLASELYDVYDQIESSGSRYQIPVSLNNDELDEAGY
jgi:hypothetical protein